MMILLIRNSVAALVVAFVVTAQYMSEDKLQSLDSHANTTTKEDFLAQEGLQPYNEEESDLESLNIESSDNQSSTANSTDSKTKKAKKPSSVPKKGVTLPKSSVVPKKGVNYAPSVVPKKGADPESSTQSVSPRKGVEFPDPKQIPPDGEPVSPSSGKMSGSSYNTKFNPNQYLTTSEDSMIRAGSDSTKNLKKVSKKPIPQLIDTGAVKENESLVSQNANANNLMSPTVSDAVQKTIPVYDLKNNTVIQSGKNVSSSLHSKPAVAVDVLVIDGNLAGSDQVNYFLVVAGLVFVIAFVVLLVAGYRKFQDVWMRRHYNHVDFLVEGMYDE